MASSSLSIPHKPSVILSANDAWNYVVWYHLTHGTPDVKSPPHHPNFWSWFAHYRQCDSTERRRLGEELGDATLKQSCELIQHFFDQAQKFRAAERSAQRHVDVTPVKSVKLD
jgi:hypothetical protein